MSLYPALSQTKFDNYLENSIEPDNPFADFDYSEKTFESPNNFKNYVSQAQSSPHWKEAEFNGYTLPAQGQSKDYCKKWVSWGCGNTAQHPHNKHYAQHEQKSCKTANCPLCFVDWINRQANRSTRRFMKFTEDRNFFFRHIVLSPPQQMAKEIDHATLKKALRKAMKKLNAETCAVVYHPFRFDNNKSTPRIAPHFHLLVYGKITNTTEFIKKSKGWFVKNKGDLKSELDIFNCVRYLLSHSGIKKNMKAIVYYGDISYRKLKVEKEPSTHDCPHCNLPLTVYRIVKSTKSLAPPIDHVGLWDSSCFEIVVINDLDNEPRIPFYDINEKTEQIQEKLLYSFEEILSVKTARKAISDRNYALSVAHCPTALQCHAIGDFS